MIVVRLPLAGTEVVVRPPAGAEDVLLLEAGAPDLGVALALLDRLTRRFDGVAIDWATIALPDVDVLLLRLRQMVIGEVVKAEVRCAAASCRARVDLSFTITGYLDHHRPRSAPRHVTASDDGWYRLAGGDVEFRVPCTADQLAIAREPDPGRALVGRCVRPADARGAWRRRVEAALDAIAPSLCSELRGACPECGAAVAARFDPLQYTLGELRDQAELVYEDVFLIAHHYHWSEAEILALPATRRARYADLAARVHGAPG